MDQDEISFDAVIGLHFLKADLWTLKHISLLPDTLDRFDLQGAAIALRFALGYEESLPKEFTSYPNGLLEFFKQWRDQPAASELLNGLSLYDANNIHLHSQLLGCKIVVDSQNSSPCIELAESFLAALESLLATGFKHQFYAKQPNLDVTINLTL